MSFVESDAANDVQGLDWNRPDFLSLPPMWSLIDGYRRVNVVFAVARKNVDMFGTDVYIRSYQKFIYRFFDHSSLLILHLYCAQAPHTFLSPDYPRDIDRLD